MPGRVVPLPERPRPSPTGIALIVEAGRRQAEEASLDRIVSTVDPEAYAAFLVRLDAPAQDDGRLRRTLGSRAPVGSRVTARMPERLAGHHSTAAFACGVPLLDDWLQRRAYTDQGDRVSRTFVICDRGRVVGYYTLASGGIGLPAAGGFTARPAPDPVPVAILGRLALDGGYQKKGLGRALVRDCAQRVIQATSVAGFRAIVVDAISAESMAFYLAVGFGPSPLDPMTLMASLADLRRAL